MATYEKPIGRYKNFPVSEVKIIEQNHWLRRLLTGKHVTVRLTDKSKFRFNRKDAQALQEAVERWKQILHLSSVVKSHQAAMQNRG